MEEKIAIYEAGTLLGQLSADRQELRTVFRADCMSPDHKGIRKLWLRNGTRELLLGTLVPEGDRLCLERTVSNAMLREKGLEHRPRAEAELLTADPEPFPDREWRSLDSLKLPGMDRELADALGRMRNGVWRRVAEGYCIRCPWQPGQRMPCMPLFCFASYSSQRGGFLTWLLDEAGNPRIKQV